MFLTLRPSKMIRPTHLRSLLHWRVSAITLVLGIVMIFVGYSVVYQRSLDASNAEIRQSMLAVADTASIAVYAENSELADEALHVLIHDPLICSAHMKDIPRSFYRYAGNAHVCHQHLNSPIVSPFNDHTTIGTLSVTINALLIRDHALKLARLISVLILFVLLGSALILGIATQALLTKPITQLANTIHHLIPGTTVRLKIPEVHRRNEFGGLISDINKLLETVELTLQEERNLRTIIHSMQQQYQSIFDHARTGIALIDEFGRCLLANPSVSTMLGLDFTADGPFCLNKYWLESVFGNNQQFQELMTTALNSGQMITRDIPLQPKISESLENQRGTWLNVSISTHHDTVQNDCRLLECVLLDISERKNKEDESRYQAEHDALTQLLNRAAGMSAIETQLNIQQSTPKGAVLLIDLDRFKYINDTYGHAAGDLVLVTTSRRMQEIFRSIDVIARLGGDEFLIGLFHVDSVNHFPAIFRRIIEELTRPILLTPDVNEHIGASIGVSLVPQCGDDLTHLMHCADEAMYQVKRAGRCGYCIYNGTEYEKPVLIKGNQS